MNMHAYIRIYKRTASTISAQHQNAVTIGTIAKKIDMVEDIRESLQLASVEID